MLSEIKLPSSVKLLVVLLSITLIVWWMYVLREILVLISFSVLFSMLLFPLCHRLEKWHFPRTLAIFICLLASFLIIAGIITIVILQMADFTDTFPAFQRKGESFINELQSWASHNLHISRKKQVAEMRDQSLNLLKNSGQIITNALGTTLNSLSSALLIPIFVFFFLLYRDFFRKFLYLIFGRGYRNRIDMIFRRIYLVVQGYLLGLLSVILIVAGLNTLGLWALGIEYAPFFGVLAAFLLLIPYIGIMIGSLLPILMALITKDSPMYALGVAGVFVFVQFLEGNFITPHIVGSKVSINPLAAMISLVLGGQVWGISGLVLALPLVAILKVVFDNIDSLKPFGYLLGEAEAPRK